MKCLPLLLPAHLEQAGGTCTQSACWMEKCCPQRPHNLPVSLQPFLWAACLSPAMTVCRAGGGGGGRSISSTKPDLLVPSQLPAAEALLSSLGRLAQQRAVSRAKVRVPTSEQCRRQDPRQICCTVEGRSSSWGRTAAQGEVSPQDVPAWAENKQAGHIACPSACQ